MVSTLKQAQQNAGKLSHKNSKMPGTTFPTTTRKCITGGALKKVPGSVCAKCYAARLEAYRDSVRQGWIKNWDITNRAILENPDKWVDGIVYQINHFFKKTGTPFHRWFDSGDLYSVDWLIAIARVARRTPDVTHWLPTKEKSIVKEYYRKHRKPANLIIRVSSAMVDGKPLDGFSHTSTVHKAGPVHGFRCMARTRGNACGDCRACWDPTIKNIGYDYH